MSKEFDLIVFGATGFTGRLVAEYLATHYGAGSDIKWAMAGRSRAKLEQVRALVKAPGHTALITADAIDGAALAALVARAKVVITTVGPYQLHGEALVMACAQAGTDYVDLCGEPGWMAQMIPRLDAPAKASGARIVFSCGFDSIPFDLGLVYLQDQAQQRFGEPLTQVRGRVRVIKGGISGGTLASGLATIERMGRDPALARTMADPFALTPGFTGAPQPEGDSAAYDDWAQAWTGPFMMATINTKNVHRTNALLGHPWGKDFTYDERMLTGDGVRGERRAKNMAHLARLQHALLGFGPARALLRRFALPKPGEGPDQKARENGRYDLQFTGESRSGNRLCVSVRGDRDPGYGSTAKMLAESALCLVGDPQRRLAGGGVWTAGSAMGLTLVQRLVQYAGLRFSIEQ
ncbi:saccharopine dehydrogenase family protein [Massilia sp. TWP1-3-3]|uniref:saccharopine dehydrogenase family protein n=1 Tax=Massilia sp. TWP1-3-3 TaxID=2804573 RepID=UPI003CEBE328